MIRAVLVALLLAVAAGPAAAMTDRQRNTIYRVADLIAAGERCSDVAIDFERLAAVLAFNDIASDDLAPDGQFYWVLSVAIETSTMMLEDKTDDEVCELMKQDFGSTGLIYR